MCAGSAIMNLRCIHVVTRASISGFGGNAFGGGVGVACGLSAAIAKLAGENVARTTAIRRAGTIIAATPSASPRADRAPRLFVMTHHNTDAGMRPPDVRRARKTLRA